MRTAARQLSVFVQLLLTLCLLLVAVVSGLSLVLGASYERGARELLERSSRQILAQVGHTLERLDASARTFAVGLLTTNPVVQLMRNESMEPWEAVRTLDLVGAQIASDSLVHSVYVYNVARDCFYTTVGNGIQRREAFFDPEAAVLVRRSASHRLMPVPRLVPPTLPLSAGNPVPVYSYLLTERLGIGAPDSCLVVNVSAAHVMDTIRSDAGGLIVILDRAARAVGYGGGTEFLADLSGVEPYRQVLASGTGSGAFTATVAGERVLVTHVTLARTEWTLVRVEPYRSVVRPILAQRILVVLITVAFVVAALALAVLFSRRLSAPVRALVEQVARALDSSRAIERGQNELLYLSQAFTETVDRVNLLDRFRDANLRLLREELFRGLLAGRHPSGAELGAKLRELELELDVEASFVCALFRADGGSASGRGVLEGIAVAEALRSVVALERPCVAVQLGDGDVALLVQCAAAGEPAHGPGSEEARALLEGALMPALGAAQAQIREAFGLSLSGALSWPRAGLAAAGAAYRQAEAVLCYRFVHGCGCLLGPWEERAAPQEGAPFPVDEEARLLACLRAADAAGALEAYADFSRLVSGQPYEAIMLALTRLAASIFDLLGVVESNSDLRFPVRFSTFMRELGARETLTGAGEAFRGLLEQSAAVLGSLVSEKSRRNVERVKEIVAERYADPGLCAAGIAGDMRMSPVYLGRIFRDACRCSIADYTTGVRLERARELLERTDRTVKEIAKAVGIDRPRYLFAKFRERYGATPTAYRRRHLGSGRGDWRASARS